MAYIKKKKDNAYLITVSCGRDSSDKKISKSVTFRPELLTAKGHPKSEATITREVQAFAAEFEKKILTGAYQSGETLTFSKYAEKYLQECATLTQAPRTLESTRAAIDHFKKDFGYMTLTSLTPLYLQEYVNQLRKAPKSSGKPGTLSESSIRRRMAVLSSMLSQAVRWNLLASNPMDRVQIRTIQSAPVDTNVKCFDREQAFTFLRILDSPLLYQYSSRSRTDRTGNTYQVSEYQAEHGVRTQLKFFFYLAIFTGCRRGELLALEWSDIDFDTSVIHITKSVCRSGGETIVKTTKTKGSLRDITVPTPVIALARQWKSEQAQGRLRIGSKWHSGNCVFTQWDGQRMGLDTPYQAFHRIIRNYNATRQPDAPELPLIPLHGLRHTAATLLIAYGTDVRTVAGRLGHSNTSTTLNIYAEYLNELDRSASDKLDNLLLCR